MSTLSPTYTEPKPGEERDFADMLTLRRIRWEYERHRIELPTGRPNFVPDFYLPELGIYVELCMAGSTTNRYRRNRALSRKQADIKWAHRVQDQPVILLDNHTLPLVLTSWDFMADLIAHARMEARRERTKWLAGSR